MTALVVSNVDPARVGWTQWFAVLVAMAIVCAISIVPDWDDMQPARPAAIGVVATIAVLSVVTCQHLTCRFHPAVLTGLLMLCGIGDSVLLGLAGSLKFAQLAGAMTAATAGCLWISWKTSDRTAIQTLLPVFVITNTCLIYTGYANSFAGIPSVAFLLVAIALCVSNLSMIPGLNSTTGFKRGLLPFALVGLPLVIGILIAVRAVE